MEAKEFLSKIAEIAERLVEYTVTARQLSENLQELAEELTDALVQVKETLTKLKKERIKNLS